MKKYICLVLAMLLSVLCISCADATSAVPSDTVGDVTTEISDKPQNAEKTYAADELLDENGHFGNDSEGELRVAYIGGSLTAINPNLCYTDAIGSIASCGNEWATEFCHYLIEKFPNRRVSGYNAGIGGTCSDYGALRFQPYVLDFDPDIVFIEFAVNDSPREKLEAQKYMEYMVNMAKQCEHEPVIVFLYAPYPVEKNEPTYERWAAGVKYKQEIADAYSVGSINVYDYLYEKYENSGKTSLMEYLAPYYGGVVKNEYDVHGGYDLYYGSIVERLENDPVSLIHRLGDPAAPVSCEIGKSVCVSCGINDPRFVFDDKWTYLGHDELFSYPNDYINIDAIEYPFFPDGVMETDKAGATLTFTSSASELIFGYVQAGIGNSATVYVDGVKCGNFSISCGIYISGFGASSVMLPGDGKEHDIKIVSDEPEGDNNLFRICMISEVFPLE